MSNRGYAPLASCCLKKHTSRAIRLTAFSIGLHHCCGAQEAVYLTDANETDAQVMERILSMQPEEISARVDKMSLLQERIYQENDKIAAAILIQTLKQQTHSQ